MKCAECQAEVEETDYLCRRCRVKLDPDEWEDRRRVGRSVIEFLHDRGTLYYGLELFYPENSPWAWLRILNEPSLADPEAITARDYFSTGELARQYAERSTIPMLVVWKSTGHIYEMDNGEVGDDPIWEAS